MQIQSLPSNIKEVYAQYTLLQKVHNLLVEKKWIECSGLANELSKEQENDFFGSFYQGICNTQLKFYEEAIENFELALINIKKNKFPRIIAEYEQETKLRIAHVYRLQRNYNEAIKHSDELIAQHPKYVAGYQLKAGIQIDLDNFQEALDTADSGLGQLPNHSELLELRNSLVYQLTARL
ncbi:MAG: tetratricopeptide repeat protein [Bacteroidota bacterium]